MTDVCLLVYLWKQVSSGSNLADVDLLTDNSLTYKDVTPGILCPTLFEQCRGFYYVPPGGGGCGASI